MSALPPYQPGQSVSDYVVSVLRTVVPVLWGALITYLISLVPIVAQVVDPGTAVGLGPAVAAALTAAWYALMRTIEPKLPAWLTVIVLGSNSSPRYLKGDQAVVNMRPGTAITHGNATVTPLAVDPDATAGGQAD